MTLKISHFQVNITTDNIVSISRNLSDHVINATDTIDQNIKNIKMISTILMKSAALLSDNVTFDSLSVSKLTMVRYCMTCNSVINTPFLFKYNYSTLSFIDNRKCHTNIRQCKGMAIKCSRNRIK